MNVLAFFPFLDADGDFKAAFSRSLAQLGARHRTAAMSPSLIALL